MSVEDLYRMDSRSTAPMYMAPPVAVAPPMPIAPMPAPPMPVVPSVDPNFYVGPNNEVSVNPNFYVAPPMPMVHSVDPDFGVYGPNNGVPMPEPPKPKRTTHGIPMPDIVLNEGPPMKYQMPSGGYQQIDPNAPTFTEAIMEPDASGDSLLENAVEFVDPLGVASYDDVYRAYNEYKAGDSGLLNLMVETVGALPVINKIKNLERVMPNWMWSSGLARPVGNAYNKVAGGVENLYGPAMPAIKAMNKGDAVQDMYSDNLTESGVVNVLPNL